jgi:hypothetical protein
MLDEPGGEPLATDQRPDFNIPRLGCFREIGRRDERDSAIHDDAFRVEAGTLDRIRVKGTRVIIEVGRFCTGPLLDAEAVGEGSQVAGRHEIGRDADPLITSGERPRPRIDEFYPRRVVKMKVGSCHCRGMSRPGGDGRDVHSRAASIFFQNLGANRATTLEY